MQKLVVFFLLLFSLSVNAQTKKDSIKAIAENLINVSATAFSKYDYNQQFSLVSEDATLILVDLAKVENKKGYYDIIKRIGEGQKSKGVVRAIQFRYNKFTINGPLAYAEGLFRITLTQGSDGAQRVQYSAFRHVYRLEKAHWRLLIDSHTTNPGLTEEDFLKAKEITEIN